MKTALRLLLAPYRFSVDRLFRMGEVGGAHWFTDPNTLYRRRNLLTYSRDFSNAAWAKSGVTATATRITATAGGTFHYVYQNQAIGTAGDAQSYTTEAKYVNNQWVFINFPNDSSLTFFDLQNGVFGSIGGQVTSYSAELLSDGYYRLVLKAPVAASHPRAGIGLAVSSSSGSFSAAGTEAVDVRNFQNELASSATEYQDVPTTWPEAYLAAVGAENIFAWVDNAGTTPVTAVGDTIGLSLDRAYGGRTDGSLIGSGATGLTGTATAASYNTSTGAGSVSRAGDASNQSWVSWTGLTTSAIHRIRITNTGATSLDVRNGGVAGTIVASIAAGATSYVHPLTSGGSTSITITATNNSTTATFTVLEFCRVPGTHLIQATGTARPTLSARVNLLLSTASFAASAWIRRGTATVGAAAPDGTGELLAGIGALGAGDVFQQQAAVTGAAYKPYVEIWPVSTSGTLVFCNPQGLPYGQWNINMTLLSTGQWNVITSSHPAVTVVNNYSGNASLAGVMFYASSGAPLSFYARRPDIRTADDAAKNIPAYQRVGATAADHDTDGFPHGQYPDGTDDNQTTTTGGGGTTGFFYCGAITVSGGAGTARTICSDTGTNTGYRVRINSSNKLELAAGNGSAYTTVASNETITAPGTYILSAWDDGGVLAVQVNNFAAATTTRPSVSAGTSTATMYKDNGAASSYLNGRDYGSVYRQSYIGESQHARLKRWLADRARITL